MRSSLGIVVLSVLALGCDGRRVTRTTNPQDSGVDDAFVSDSHISDDSDVDVDSGEFEDGSVGEDASADEDGGAVEDAGADEDSGTGDEAGVAEDSGTVEDAGIGSDSGIGASPTILSFTANVPDLGPSSSVTFSLVAGDADGVADLAGATLFDLSSGATYGALTGSSGTYSITLNWNQIQSLVPINFTDPVARTFSVRVFDAEGHTTNGGVSVTMTCGEEHFGACNGVCTDLSGNDNCGSCGNACTEGLSPSCNSGVCTPCPGGVALCDGWCVSGTCGTPTDGDIGINPTGTLSIFHSGSWRGICDDEFDMEDAIVACSQFWAWPWSVETDQTGPSAQFWLDSLACGGSEPSIVACSHPTWGSEDCEIDEWVRLSCYYP